MEVGSTVKVENGRTGQVTEINGSWIKIQFDDDGHISSFRAKHLTVVQRHCSECDCVLNPSEYESGMCWLCEGKVANFNAIAADYNNPQPLVVDDATEALIRQIAIDAGFNYCQCGCGKIAKRMFVQGHDQRHKGNLLRLVRNDARADAANELVRRGWRSYEEAEAMLDKAVLDNGGILTNSEGDPDDPKNMLF